MKALVIYESIFGNTMKIAEAIGEGLRGQFEVDVMEVDTAVNALDGASLLVIGGPTHAWGMTRGNSRMGALEQAEKSGVEAVSKGIGIRDWLREQEKRAMTLPAAAFDTALKKPKWFPVGSAARSAGSQLKKKGFELAVKPEQFYVTDTEGPLLAGELERAREWGRELGEAVMQTLPPRPVAVSV